MRECLLRARRIVVKVGSSLLTANGQRLDNDYIEKLCHQIVTAIEEGYQIALVSSGAVAAGIERLQWDRRPQGRINVQAAAAVGQMRLINAYESAFSCHSMHTAQVLLTAEDMSHRTLYLNARATLRHMLDVAIIPIINENDVIATDLVSFGDNDCLAAQVTNLLEADILLMLTDAPGLCRDASTLSDVVSSARAADESLRGLVSSGITAVGSGGMASKLAAARIAARSGAHSLIVSGRDKNCISKALHQEFGTLLFADLPRLSARKQWLASGLHPRGKMMLDAGAVEAIVKKKRSLLPAGVTAVSGDFIRGDAVVLVDTSGNLIGHALTNYSAAAAHLLCGIKSDRIAQVLGYAHEEEMAHRDNMSVLAS